MARAGLLLVALGVSCAPPGRGGPVPQESAGVAIRINQLGYRPDALKVGVACALEPRVIATFRVVDERNRTVFGPRAVDAAGPFGPCAATYRLDFSALRRPGVYSIMAGSAISLPVRISDVLAEARWGLEGLLKMYPEDDLLLNQLGDDRDHTFWDLPVNDSADYGWGRGGRRPVYPCTGKPQGLFENKNRSTGLASTAGKYAAAFALGAAAFTGRDSAFARRLAGRARAAYALEAVARRARNGFRIGIPFIWCSNNLLASFATQATFYRRMTGDSTYVEYETAALDWLFGTNPWGVSMVIGLGDAYPRTPHSVVAEQLHLQL